MARWIITRVMATLFVWLFCSVNSFAVTKALIISISKYPIQSGWINTAANNDAVLIESTLRKRGVKESNLIFLKEEKATYQSIIHEFKLMDDRLSPSDTLFLFFAGHGQQIADDNGDEDDGWDEAFIPYDAHKRYKKGIYEGEKHLRDDEIGVWLDRFRKKAGHKGAIWVIIDACHSGTANRDETNNRIRGTTYPFHAPETKKALTTSTHSFRLKSLTGHASIGVFSACQPDQVNYEFRASNYRYYGRLTYAFCSLIAQYGNLDSYQSLFRLVKKEMGALNKASKTQQNPYFETTEK